MVRCPHRTPAHPRSRGENRLSRLATLPLVGSSPLTRGKPARPILAPYLPRLIPAHAGKTAVHHHGGPDPQAHPRSRGENNAHYQSLSSQNGSSPLTRGKPCRHLRSDSDGGLIPAHAGKTFYVYHCFPDRRAHPRSRGENATRVRHAASRGGSSPLTRGKQDGAITHVPCIRLIPAHAGKTFGSGLTRRWTSAHPRSRGENRTWAITVAISLGSSPLTRGKRAIR